MTTKRKIIFISLFVFVLLFLFLFVFILFEIAMSINKTCSSRENAWISSLKDDVFFLNNTNSLIQMYKDLRQLGYKVDLYEINHSKLYLQNMFLQVYHSKETFFIDVNFREKFIIVRPTKQYTYILQRIPKVFVGKIEDLICIVNFVADQMKKSFKENNLELPPWRERTFILRKWFD